LAKPSRESAYGLTGRGEASRAGLSVACLENGRSVEMSDDIRGFDDADGLAGAASDDEIILLGQAISQRFLMNAIRNLQQLSNSIRI
jgi:hypothetical protein